jgi:hypothetical protein
MKELALSALLLVASAFTTFAGTERLIGTWKSNKGATVAHLKIHTKLTAMQIEKVGSTLGEMTVTFDAENATFKHRDWEHTAKYKIVKEEKNTLTIESENLKTKKPEKTRLEFDTSGKGFWVPDAKIEGYKERFDKLPK